MWNFIIGAMFGGMCGVGIVCLTVIGKQADEDMEHIEKKKETSSKKNKKKQNVQSDKQKREAQIRSFCGQHFKKKNYLEHKEELVQAILKGKSRMQINNNLMKIFPSETVAFLRQFSH